MLPQRSGTRDHAHALGWDEHRIRLLTNLAASLAQIGLVEEALEACKAIARLRAPLNEAGSALMPRRLALQPSEP